MNAGYGTYSMLVSRCSKATVQLAVLIKEVLFTGHRRCLLCFKFLCFEYVFEMLLPYFLT
jgi:hypothetical protein